MPFAAALDEVAVVIEDAPTPEQLRDNDLPADEWLYGLYEGVPRTEWGADWSAHAEQDQPVPLSARGGLP